MDGHVNWIAVILGALLAFLAWLYWYGPRPFGTKWAEGSGVELAKDGKISLHVMLAQGAALLTLSAVIGLTAAMNALGTAIIAVVAAGLFVLSSGAFSRKSNYATFVDIGFVLLAGVIMIVVQGIL